MMPLKNLQATPIIVYAFCVPRFLSSQTLNSNIQNIFHGLEQKNSIRKILTRRTQLYYLLNFIAHNRSGDPCCEANQQEIRLLEATMVKMEY